MLEDLNAGHRQMYEEGNRRQAIEEQIANNQQTVLLNEALLKIAKTDKDRRRYKKVIEKSQAAIARLQKELSKL